MAVVIVPMGIEEYVVEHDVEAVRDGGAACLARCLAIMPDKQPAALIATAFF